MIQSLVTFTSQMILVAIIIFEIVTGAAKAFFVFDPNYQQIFARFICTLILHLFLLGELTGALERMKFVLNHEYKFAAPGFAFANTVTQATAIIFVELCSVLVILGSNNAQDTVMNFIALAIIAAFDDYVYNSSSNEILKKLLSDEVKDNLCVVAHTTSKRAKDWEMS